MVKSIAVLGLLAAVSSSAAQAATVEWRGIAFISSVTTGCVNEHVVGDNVRFRYRPAGLGDNGGGDRMSFFDNFHAQSFVGTVPFTSSFANVSAGHVGQGWSKFSSQAQIRISSRSPTDLSTLPKSVALVGAIKNFSDVAGCNVGFYGSGALKP